MDPQTWQKIQAIIDEAVELAPEQQAGFVAQQCGDDTQLLYEVNSLLNAEQKSEALFDKVALPDQVDVTKTIGGLRQFDHYTILCKIDVGGMGIVYKALDSRLDRQVAIKFLSPQFCQSEPLRKRFLSEARIISKIDHPNICVIFDVGETDDQALYLVMPFYDGCTLREHIKQQPLAPVQVIDIMIQVCEGLTAAHQQKIIHRDIKPANIMLTASGVAKILDFGIAKISGDDNTRTGEALGTVAYMSPEQLTGKPVTISTDIWSLGVMLFELISSVRPYTANSSFELAHIILTKPRLALAQFIEQPEPALEAILDKALALEPQERFLSVLEMADALRALATSMGSTSAWLRTEAGPTIDDGHGTWASAPQITIDTQELIRLELARYVGPLANVLINGALARHHSVKELCQALAESIDQPADRAAFLGHIDQWSMSSYAHQSSSATAPNQQTLPDQQVLDHIETEMTRILGPIAGTLLKRAVARSQTVDELAAAIGNCFEEDGERELFERQLKQWL